MFGAVIFFLVSVGSGSQAGALTTVAFVLGAITSMAAGYLGMMIAVYSNARCVESCHKGTQRCFIRCSPEPTPSRARMRLFESTIARRSSSVRVLRGVWLRLVPTLVRRAFGDFEPTQ